MASEPKTVPTPDIADKLEVEGRPMSMHTAAANEGNRGFSLFVTVHIAPERMDEFLGYFQPVYDRLSAMPECGLFQVYRSPTDAGVLAWVEDWYVPTYLMYYLRRSPTPSRSSIQYTWGTAVQTVGENRQRD